MWLLDANMAVQLADALAGLGIECDTAKRRGWAALQNGELVAALVQSGFTCILTQDRLFASSAAQALRENETIGVVIITLPQRPWEEYQEQFLAAWNRTPIQPLPGHVINWP